MEDTKELRELYKLRMELAIKNFKKNGFDAVYFDNTDEAVNFFFDKLDKDKTISHGGSRTLDQLGVLDKLRHDGYNLLDRMKKGITKEEKRKVERDAFSADVYIASANAVSLTGSVVNIDLNGNRCSAIAYGPDKVYLFIGRNKVCVSDDEAIYRARNYACVMNAIRFNRETPCTKTGYCHDCNSDDSICGVYTIIDRCSVKDRICLVFINDELGF